MLFLPNVKLTQKKNLLFAMPTFDSLPIALLGQKLNLTCSPLQMGNTPLQRARLLACRRVTNRIFICPYYYTCEAGRVVLGPLLGIIVCFSWPCLICLCGDEHGYCCNLLHVCIYCTNSKGHCIVDDLCCTKRDPRVFTPCCCDDNLLFKQDQEYQKYYKTTLNETLNNIPILSLDLVSIVAEYLKDEDQEELITEFEKEWGRKNFFVEFHAPVLQSMS